MFPLNSKVEDQQNPVIDQIYIIAIHFLHTWVDPFTSHNTLNIFWDILDAIKKDPYERDPRGTAKKAEAYLKKSGIGEKCFFGPGTLTVIWP